MDESQTKFAMYKYVLYPGNNSAVIQDALAKRKVWVALDKEKILLANFIWKPLNYPEELYDNFQEIMRYEKNKNVMLNHFENNKMICTKSGLVRSLKHYYSHDNAIYEQNYHVFQTIPTTFVVNLNKQSAQYKDFLERFVQLQAKNFSKQKIPAKHCEKNIWYIKPQASNQGKGITITNSLKEIENLIFSKVTNTSYILQKAIEKPLLYNKRKFDVRVWTLVTANLEIYFYKVPYIRTSSYEYNDTEFDQFIHLTNNCQQKYFDQYSKYEEGNTIPFQSLKNILIEMGKTDADELMNKILQRMKSLVVDCFLSVRKFFLRNVKKKEFQLFGFDFLIDEDLRTWLLEVNNNPYLGIPNKFIKELLPKMIDEMLEIVLDPLFPPIDYKPIQTRNYELLHKEVSLFRINPLRSSGSMENKRKDYYPMEEYSFNISREFSIGAKSRRNSQPLALGLYATGEKTTKIRYSTPAQTVKNLLQTYCFSDLDPFLIPVNFILTSPKLEQKQHSETSIRNVKLITETRICHILLEPKFLSICKNILQSQTHPQQIKVCLLNGYSNAIRSYKNRSSVIKTIVPILNEILNIHSRQPDPQGLITQDPLIEAIIMLLIRLGEVLNRKVFIPGETREKQNSRQLFITSNTFKILLKYKQNFPKLCNKSIQELLTNFNEKDWQLHNSIQKGQQNSKDPTMLLNENNDNYEKINKSQMGSQQRRLSLRQKIEIQYLRSYSKGANISTLPKIKKLK